MVEKITLTKTYKSDKDKAGNPLKTKDGRPYTRLAVQSKEYGTSWLSGFLNRETESWTEGSVVEVEINKVAGKDGKEYINFKTLSPEDKMWKELQRQASEIHTLKQQMASVLRNFGEVPEEEVEKVNEELDGVKEADLPF